jgi:hypothetical protein
LDLKTIRRPMDARNGLEKILKTANLVVGGEANGDHGIVNRQIGFPFAVFIQVDKVELLVQLVLGGRWKLAADGFLFASPKVATKKKKIAGSPKDSTNSQRANGYGNNLVKEKCSHRYHGGHDAGMSTLVFRGSFKQLRKLRLEDCEHLSC